MCKHLPKPILFLLTTTATKCGLMKKYMLKNFTRDQVFGFSTKTIFYSCVFWFFYPACFLALHYKNVNWAKRKLIFKPQFLLAGVVGQLPVTIKSPFKILPLQSIISLSLRWKTNVTGIDFKWFSGRKKVYLLGMGITHQQVKKRIKTENGRFLMVCARTVNLTIQLLKIQSFQCWNNTKSKFY